jgi:hypothetical protein
MPEYIEKIRVMARVSRPGEPVLEGILSHAPHSQFHEGPETLLELLNLPVNMLPFQRLSDDATLLLSRLDIQWLMAGPGVAPDLVRPHAFRFTREERVRVRLRGGEELEGLLQMELPEMINRASDYLNGPESFFPLASRQGVFLIQHARTREIQLYDSSPLPVPYGAVGG